MIEPGREAVEGGGLGTSWRPIHIPIPPPLLPFVTTACSLLVLSAPPPSVSLSIPPFPLRPSLELVTGGLRAAGRMQ